MKSVKFRGHKVRFVLLFNGKIPYLSIDDVKDMLGCHSHIVKDISTCKRDGVEVVGGEDILTSVLEMKVKRKKKMEYIEILYGTLTMIFTKCLGTDRTWHKMNTVTNLGWLMNNQGGLSADQMNRLLESAGLQYWDKEEKTWVLTKAGRKFGSDSAHEDQEEQDGGLMWDVDVIDFLMR